jgi:hypothetical protein
LRANGEVRNQLLHLDEKEPELARLGAKRSGLVLPLAFLGLHDPAVGVERQQPMILLYQRSFRCIGTEFLWAGHHVFHASSPRRLLRPLSRRQGDGDFKRGFDLAKLAL